LAFSVPGLRLAAKGGLKSLALLKLAFLVFINVPVQRENHGGCKENKKFNAIFRANDSQSVEFSVLVRENK
jgi:hypothetical protein